MKSVTVRLPESLALEIESEARRRGIQKSDVVRQRLQAVGAEPKPPVTLEAIADLIGSVDRLPPALSGQTKRYLKATGYGRQRRR